MLSFESDYIMGAHPKIFEKMMQTNYQSQPGYGADAFSRRAVRKIRKACGSPKAQVFFLAGGTQTNQIVISALTRSYEGVIGAGTSHINTHEAGAIEYSGHKVLTLPEHMGKIDPEELDRYIKDFYDDGNHEHMVFPGMVYISHPTEYGTLYTKQELIRLSEICRNYGIPLYMDGARLGYGLASRHTDVTLEDIAKLCDVFYIGGTKAGALLGEALVFPRGNAPKHMETMIKQHGALLAKGRVLGIQFDVLFSDDLYMKISGNAIDKAEKLISVFEEAGYDFYLKSPTNQQFIILENDRLERLREKVAFSFWEKLDENRTVVRFATSWATTDGDIEQLRKILQTEVNQ